VTVHETPANLSYHDPVGASKAKAWHRWLDLSIERRV